MSIDTIHYHHFPRSCTVAVRTNDDGITCAVGLAEIGTDKTPCQACGGVPHKPLDQLNRTRGRTIARGRIVNPRNERLSTPLASLDEIRSLITAARALERVDYDEAILPLFLDLIEYSRADIARSKKPVQMIPSFDELAGVYHEEEEKIGNGEMKGVARPTKALRRTLDGR